MTREIRVDGDVAYVPLTRGLCAVIDAADVQLVSGNRWYADRVRKTGLFYASRIRRISGVRRTIRMHNVIMGECEGLIDHRDGDGLNNRRSNLRRCERPGLNQANRRRPPTNTSGFKGVVRTRNGKPWAAQIHVSGKNIYLGRFDSAHAAATAYDAAALKHFGEFASLNFPADTCPAGSTCHAAVLMRIANGEVSA